METKLMIKTPEDAAHVIRSLDLPPEIWIAAVLQAYTRTRIAESLDRDPILCDDYLGVLSKVKVS